MDVYKYIVESLEEFEVVTIIYGYMDLYRATGDIEFATTADMLLRQLEKELKNNN